MMRTKTREPYATVTALSTFTVIYDEKGKGRIAASTQHGVIVNTFGQPLRLQDGEHLVHVETGSTWNTFNTVVIDYRDRFIKAS